MPIDKKAQAEAARAYIDRLDHRISVLSSQARNADKEGMARKARRYRDVIDDVKEERALATMIVHGGE